MAKTQTLTPLHLTEGVWHGALHGWEAAPDIEVQVAGRHVAAEVSATAEQGVWEVRVAIPADAISDGVQTFLIRDTATGETLGSFALMAGRALDEDIRAELDLLRQELDLLKRAFRRHCTETL